MKEKSKWKKKTKQHISPRGGSIPAKMVSEAVALYNEPRKHHLLDDQIYNILSVTIKYEPSVFSAIFRHKQPQNVNLKQLALLKWIYYGTLAKSLST